jgi:hypothetical protein
MHNLLIKFVFLNVGYNIKEHNQQIKQAIYEWQKILTNNISAKELLSRIYKEFL